MFSCFVFLFLTLSFCPSSAKQKFSFSCFFSAEHLGVRGFPLKSLKRCKQGVWNDIFSKYVLQTKQQITKTEKKRNMRRIPQKLHIQFTKITAFSSKQTNSFFFFLRQKFPLNTQSFPSFPPSLLSCILVHDFFSLYQIAAFHM